MVHKNNVSIKFTDTPHGGPVSHQKRAVSYLSSFEAETLPFYFEQTVFTAYIAEFFCVSVRS